jgi:hypothetical protein
LLLSLQGQTYFELDFNSITNNMLARAKSVDDMAQIIRAAQQDSIALPLRARDDMTITLREKRQEAIIPKLVRPDEFYKWMASFKWKWDKVSRQISQILTTC